MISEVLQGSFERFEEATLLGLATAAVAGPGAPLGLIATATGRSSGALGELLEPALSAGVLDQVSPVGVHFRHALFAETVAGLLDTHALDARLASAWEAVGGLDARASAAGHRVRAATTAAEIADAVPTTCEVAAELAANPDGSITLTFGPTEPDEDPGNWIQTVAGKKWFTILRLYGPLEPWFEPDMGSWRDRAGGARGADGRNIAGRCVACGHAQADHCLALATLPAAPTEMRARPRGDRFDGRSDVPVRCSGAAASPLGRSVRVSRDPTTGPAGGVD